MITWIVGRMLCETLRSGGTVNLLVAIIWLTIASTLDISLLAIAIKVVLWAIA